MTDVMTKCSAKAERCLPISAVRMMGLETAAAILGGVDVLAGALGITPRGVRHKLTGDRGISDADLIAAAVALDARAARVAGHAAKLRAEAGGNG